MSHNFTKRDTSHNRENFGDVICEFIEDLMKETKLKPCRNLKAMMKSLGNYMAQLVATVEGRRLLYSIKQLVFRIKNKRDFLTVSWRMFHVAGRICAENFGRLSLLFMGIALLVFLLSTVTGLAEGILAAWFTLAARAFAAQLFSRSASLMRQSIKETIPNKEAFVNLLNTFACGSGQECEQVSEEEIRQLNARDATGKLHLYHDWVLL